MRKYHGSEGARFLEAECVDIEPEEKKIRCKDKSGIVGDVSDFKVSLRCCLWRHVFVSI